MSYVTVTTESNHVGYGASIQKHNERDNDFIKKENNKRLEAYENEIEMIKKDPELTDTEKEKILSEKEKPVLLKADSSICLHTELKPGQTYKDYCNELFKDTLKKHNEKQLKNRHYDKIKKTYCQMVKDDKRQTFEGKSIQEPYFELIVQVGGKEHGQIEPGKAEAILRENAKLLVEKYQNIKFIDIEMHLDETTPHLHCVAVPTSIDKKGLLSSNMDLAAKTMGYGQPGKDGGLEYSKKALFDSFRELTDSICRVHGIDIIHPERKATREDMTLTEYKHHKEVAKAQEKLKETQETYRMIERATGELIHNQTNLEYTVQTLKEEANNLQASTHQLILQKQELTNEVTGLQDTLKQVLQEVQQAVINLTNTTKRGLEYIAKKVPGYEDLLNPVQHGEKLIKDYESPITFDHRGGKGIDFQATLNKAKYQASTYSKATEDIEKVAKTLKNRDDR